MNKQRGLKFFAWFAFISILFILSAVLISGQYNEDISFRYENKVYFYNTSSELYETLFTGDKLNKVPYGAEDIKGFEKGFEVKPGVFDNFGEKLANNKGIKYVFGTTGSDNIFERGFALLGYGSELKEYTSERYCVFNLAFSPITQNSQNVWESLGWSFLQFFTLVIPILIFLWLIKMIILYIKNKSLNRNVPIQIPINAIIDAKVGVIIAFLVIFILSIMPCAGIGPIIRGLGSIYLAGILCWTLINLVKFIIDGVDIDAIKEISESLIFKFKDPISFANLFGIIFGSIFILLNIPGISILKPIFWPLFTDYGMSLGFPFALEVTNINADISNLSFWTDYLNIAAPILGLTFLRALVFGLISFLVLLVIGILIKSHKLIVKGINAYQESKRSMDASRGYQDLITGAEAITGFGRQIRKKPRNI